MPNLQPTKTHQNNMKNAPTTTRTINQDLDNLIEQRRIRDRQTFRQIAAETGHAHTTIKRRWDHIKPQGVTPEELADHRAEELAKLQDTEQRIHILFLEARSEGNRDDQFKAIDRLLKISDARAKWLGQSVTVKHEITVTPEQLLARVEEFIEVNEIKINTTERSAANGEA